MSFFKTWSLITSIVFFIAGAAFAGGEHIDADIVTICMLAGIVWALWAILATLSEKKP